MEIISYIGLFFAALFIIRLFRGRFGFKTWFYLVLAIGIWMLPTILNNLGIQAISSWNDLVNLIIKYFNIAKEWTIDTYDDIINM